MESKEKTFTDLEIMERLKKDLQYWSYESGWIRRKYKTSGWKSTLMVVNTIGHLAELNSSRLSSDQKAVMKKKHNEYREKTDSLPVKGKRLKKNAEKPWYRSNNNVVDMTPTQQKNYVRTGKKNG